MDELFGDDKPKQQKKRRVQQQPKSADSSNTNTISPNNIATQDPQKKPRKQRKVKRRKQQPQKISSNTDTSKQLQLPMIIKIHRSLQCTDSSQLSLQQFIEFMYPEQPQPDSKARDKIIRSFEKEDDEGNIQYKLKLIKPSEDRLDHLATQMKFRIGEGLGQAYYRIGVEDDGKVIGLDKNQMYESLKTICTIASKIHADITAVRVSEGIKGNIAELMVTKNQKQGLKLEIRLLLIGQSNSGKSTLLGVIKSGQRDDGKGYSRTKVFTHKDQFMSGITQTKSHHIIAFDSKGRLFNHGSMMSIQSWLENSSKVLSFIDVGGHKEKQVVSSLCSFFPEYALWVVSGINQTVNTSCIQLAKIFNLPLIVVITHLDRLDKQQQMQTVLRLKKTLKQLYPDKAPSIIKQMQNAVLFSRITSTQDVIPIFLISSVTGKNLQLLINFFNLLTSTSQLRNNQDLHAQFLISNKFVLDKNIVLAGTVIKGTIKRGQILHLGPDAKGTFRAVQVQSIECMRVPVKLSKCGQVCTIGIKLLSYARQWLQREPNAIRRGMVLIQSKSNPKATHEFTATFIPYSNQSAQIKITAKYQPVVNTLTTRQICDIIVMGGQDGWDVGGMVKKKSRSIDTFQSKRKGHSLSVLKGAKKSCSFGDDKCEEEKGFNKKKQSEDLTSTYQMHYGEGHQGHQGPEGPEGPEGQCKPPQASPLTQSPSLTQSPLLSKPQQFSESPHLKKPKLSPILQTKQQGRLKKKKVDRDNIQIKFSNSEPTTLRLRFKYYPEYLENGQKMVINQLKLIGQVTELHY